VTAIDFTSLPVVTNQERFKRLMLFSVATEIYLMQGATGSLERILMDLVFLAATGRSFFFALFERLARRDALLSCREKLARLFDEAKEAVC
jgi:hypothetical protein